MEVLDEFPLLIFIQSQASEKDANIPKIATPHDTTMVSSVA